MTTLRLLRSFAALGIITLLVAAGAWANGCAEAEGCLGGDDGSCVPPTPCQALSFSCDDGGLQLRRVRNRLDRPPGLDALAAAGDIIIGNSRMMAVIDALEARHYLSPAGGTIIDMVPLEHGRPLREGGNDELNQILHTVGILPDDAVHYRSLELLDATPQFVAVIARGQLDGRPDVDVVTRYEVRPCEPGIRVRTDVYHGGRDPQTFFLTDVFYWGGREATPFVPLPGQGFVQPELDLEELDDALFDIPFMAAQGHAPGAAAYGEVRCDERELEAFQDVNVSAAGKPRRIILPGDGMFLERFISVAPGPGASGAIDACIEARGDLWNEASSVVRGKVRTAAGVPLGSDERRVELLFYEPDAGSGRTPYNQTVPKGDGSFEVRLPTGKSYEVQAYVLGRPVPGPASFHAGSNELVIDDIVLPELGSVWVRTTDGAGTPVIADVVLTPAAPTTAAEVGGSVFGVFDVAKCAPYLGPPHGGSPGCNRVLSEGNVRFLAPTGSYWIYISRGPFATIMRQKIQVRPGQQVNVELASDLIADLVPAGVLSADFHVHAGASFDSSLPERDRALSFVASGVDVLAATDHDVVTTYATSIADLGIGDRVIVMPGVETTGQILFHRPPGSEIPQVVGHYGFWPLRSSSQLPRNGAPDDEQLEPGALFDRVDSLYQGLGVRQLNHPFSDTVFGRDEGFLTAISYDPRVAVPAQPSDTPEGQLPRRPGGGARNIDHHVQEVMNGSDTKGFQNYRRGWHSFLNQGILRGGTANSDSHTLAVQVMGFPRNLVFGGHSLADFDRDRFNTDVREGRMVGTNGPVLDVCVGAPDGDCQGPSLSPLSPDANAVLHIELRAAPWIPVSEIRVLVNGRQERLIIDELEHPDDPFGTAGLHRYTGDIKLADLLENSGGDAWIVVEAGYPIPTAADLDDDGLVDTTDNNGDGRIDANDGEDEYREPAAPEEDDPRFHLYTVAPGTWPTTFTNPFIIDRDGDGYQAPGL
jgi:hypothetical protein